MKYDDKNKLREELMKLSILKPVHIILYQMQVLYGFLRKIDDYILDEVFKITELDSKGKQRHLQNLSDEFNFCFKILLFYAYYVKSQNLYLRYNILTDEEIRSEVMLEGINWIDIYNSLLNSGDIKRIQELGKGPIYDKTTKEEKEMVDNFYKIYHKLVLIDKEKGYERELNI